LRGERAAALAAFNASRPLKPHLIISERGGSVQNSVVPIAGRAVSPAYDVEVTPLNDDFRSRSFTRTSRGGSTEDEERN
jgi:hypothetical protein